MFVTVSTSLLGLLSPWPNGALCSLALRVLYRIEERLRDVGSGNLVTRMNELPVVQHDLMELEDECVKVAKIFEVI